MKVQFKQWIILTMIAPFSWSKWVDISTFSWGSEAYLLQGKVNRRTNAKRFLVTAISSRFKVADPRNVSIEELDKCGLIERELTPQT